MTRVAVLDDYLRRAAGFADWDQLGDQVEVTFFHDRMAEAELVGALAPFEVVVLMRERTAMPRKVLEALPNLALLVTTGMVNGSIDLDCLAERGIRLAGTAAPAEEPGLSGTGELAWALILALTKRVVVEDRALRRGAWQLDFPGNLRGATLGLLGLGRVGGEMVGPARAFGMEVVAWSEHLSPARAREVGVERLGAKEEVLERADVVSIHLRLSERTRGLLGAGELALLRPTAILINTSRGPIVDEAALLEALSSNRLAGAGLDVYDEEPLPRGHPLTLLDNVVLTPHLGYVSEERFRQMYAQAVEDISAFLAGRPLRLIV